jgi:uncharacterized membrane-anchored protein YhcB (DUF1043 family)
VRVIDLRKVILELQENQTKVKEMDENLSDGLSMSHILGNLPKEYENVADNLARDSTKTITTVTSREDDPAAADDDDDASQHGIGEENEHIENNSTDENQDHNEELPEEGWHEVRAGRETIRYEATPTGQTRSGLT